MYCVNCGVKLADTEKVCPLCGVAAFHPDILRPEGERLYPPVPPKQQLSPWGTLIVVTTLFLLPLLITLVCDLEITGSITWSGYVIGALIVVYVPFVLPLWFRKRNPVIFVPCGFAALGLYLLYINFATGGRWFLSFAFPVVGAVGLIVTGVVTLLRYVRRGQLYIFGGALMLLGGFMPVMELLMSLTFDFSQYIGWAWFPFVALVLLGGMLIFLGICRPARQTMERKFFL